MKSLLILVSILALASAKSIDIDQSQAHPIESIGIDWSQVRPIEDTDQYWARLPAELQYLRKQQPDQRIVNGQEATPGQFPYQVFLQTQRGGSTYNCGGSILNSNNILTAAHCVWRAEGGMAILGAHNRQILEPTQQRIPFAKIFYNGHYNENTSENDVAVVRLSRTISYNDRVQAVRLPARGDNRQFAGLTATLSGFGRLCYECSSSDLLQYTVNPILSNSDCVVQWPNSGSIRDSNICLSANGGRGSCQGDSGGPLTVVDGGSALQVGIVSFSIRCGEYPSVMARVTSYLDWILHITTL